MGNPVQAMSGLGSLEIASSEIGRAITIHLAGESARVGLAQGYTIPKFNGETAERWADSSRRETWQALDTMLTPKSAGGRNWKASMAQDVHKRRPTEIDYMNGHVVAKGKEKGVSTPVSAATVAVVREIDAGSRKQAPENIAEVLRLAGL
jgi:2-dehydropantoate 2-reductase